MPLGTLDSMTFAHSSSTSTARPWLRTAGVAALALALTAGLAACAPAAGDELAGSDAPPVDNAEDSTSEEGTDEALADGGLSPDDVGNATLHINGVEFPDFTGDCEISRGFGTEDIGDLNEGDISAIIGIDNVKAHEDIAMNYVAISEERFRFRDLTGAAGVDGSPATGEITLMTELGPRTPDGSRDIVEVRFSGVLEDGTELDADVVCELQNKY